MSYTALRDYAVFARGQLTTTGSQIFLNGSNYYGNVTGVPLVGSNYYGNPVTGVPLVGSLDTVNAPNANTALTNLINNINAKITSLGRNTNWYSN